MPKKPLTRLHKRITIKERTIMSKKIIGIKQADGSFFPILEDGEASNKTLELTTVRDGQTTVKVNLYKQDEDSEDLEYVDTLLIENLVPHLKEEPSFNLSINLDDDNVLTAEVLDPETGAKSDTSVSLVTLSEAQQGDSMDFALADNTDAFDDFATSDLATGTDDDFSSLADFDDESLSDSLNMDSTVEDDFSFSDNDELGEDFNTDALGESAEETSDDFSMDDDDFAFSETESMSDDATINETTDEEEFDFPKNIELQDDLTPTEYDLPDSLGDIGEDFDTTSMDLGDDDFSTASTDIGSDDFSTESMDLGDDDFSTASTDIGSDDFSSESMDLGDDDFSSESMDLGDDDFSTESMDLGDDDFSTESMDLGDDTFSSDSLDLGDSSTAGTIDFNEDFDLGSDENSLQMGEENETFSDTFGSNEGAEFSMDSIVGDVEYADFGEQEKKEEKSTSFIPPLYDKKLKDDIQKKRSRKKYPLTMIICVICAIICIIAVILAFAFGSWPGENPSVVNNVVTVEPPQVFEQEKIEEIKAGRDVPPPTVEENTIEVVIEEEVVPVKPAPAPEAIGENINYLLTWGDTLWDLSDTYYRNPWLYGTIADANNLDNPDRIIAGTYIIIPPR